MVSITHEGLLQPFQHRPALAAELLADVLGVKLPGWQQAQLGPSDLTDLVPTEYRADTVVVLYRDDGVPPGSPGPARDPRPATATPVQAVVVEVQLGKDAAKRYTWPVYLSTLRARLRCPTALLVVCPQAAVAAWCADPIELGHPDWVLTHWYWDAIRHRWSPMSRRPAAAPSWRCCPRWHTVASTRTGTGF
jgi:hypothetical protein